jgi:hypothetical protein
MNANGPANHAVPAEPTIAPKVGGGPADGDAVLALASRRLVDRHMPPVALEPACRSALADALAGRDGRALAVGRSSRLQLTPIQQRLLRSYVGAAEAKASLRRASCWR